MLSRSPCFCIYFFLISDHNSSILECILKTVNDVQQNVFNHSKRLGNIESDVQDISSRLHDVTNRKSSCKFVVPRDSACGNRDALIVEEMDVSRGLYQQSRSKRDEMEGNENKHLKMEENMKSKEVLMSGHDAGLQKLDKDQKLNLDSTKPGQCSDFHTRIDYIECLFTSKLDVLKDLLHNEQTTVTLLTDKTERLTNLTMLMMSRVTEETPRIPGAVVDNKIKHKLDKDVCAKKMKQRTKQKKSIDEESAPPILPERRETRDFITENFRNLQKEIKEKTTALNQILDGKVTQLAQERRDNHQTQTQNFTKLFEHFKENRSELNTLKQQTDDNIVLMQEIKAAFKINGAFHNLIRLQTNSVIDHLVAESTITREAMGKHRKPRQKYVCDFYVTDFDDWVGSDKDQYSRLWYIDQANDHVKAVAWFSSCGKMYVRLVHGCCDSVIGVSPRPNIKLTAKAKIINQLKADRVMWLEGVGEEEEKVEPLKICDGWESTSLIQMYKEVACSEIKKQHFVYFDNKLLIRFEICIL